jgi:nucleoid DNA-binding protein
MTVVAESKEDHGTMAKASAKRKSAGSAGSTGTKSMSKSELVGAIAESTELTRRDVNNVLESLSSQIEKSLGRRGPGVFTIPGLVKIEKRKVPARKARRGVPNPFKPGELMDVAARPASTKIKVRPLKNLKGMA